MRRSHDLDASLTIIARSIEQQRALLMEQGPSPTALNQALLDAVGLFERLGMRYALVGGIAAMYYGRARFTDDLDFAAEFLYEDTLKREPDVMRDFHFDPSCSYKLYHENGVEIDLLRDEWVEGVLERVRDATLAGRIVKIADPNDLVAMKLRAARPQDDYDVSEMIKAGAVDDGVVKALVTPGQFDHFLDLRRRSPAG